MTKIVSVPIYSDKRGQLGVLEKNIPFKIKRVFFILNPSLIRGNHGHKKTIIALICLVGSCKIIINEKKVFKLDSPSKCLILSPNSIHVLRNFKKKTILLALASQKYDYNDYIYNLKK